MKMVKEVVMSGEDKLGLTYWCLGLKRRVTSELEDTELDLGVRGERVVCL